MLDLFEITLGTSDFQTRKTGFISPKSMALSAGDLVTDKHGFLGLVHFTTESKGVWVEFVDGLEGYDRDLKVGKLKKISISNEQFFNQYKRYYGSITSLARIIHESIENDFPHVGMFFNGKVIRVRGSTLSSTINHHTSAKIGDNHSLFSAVLSPFYSCEIESFDIKRGRRKSSFAFLLLKNLLLDIASQQTQRSRFKFIVSDTNDYNLELWVKINKMFKNFNLKMRS